VNAEELAAAVDELDTRLERLRVLMDMYFQGIEKIPPNVVQKDVDRRIWILRREKIRNTGTRFRFQQIVQRYNTFGSYWQRILREIENGTYKRDVLRAKKRFGPDAQKAPVPAVDTPSSVELNEDDLMDDLSDFGDLGPLPTAPRAAPPPPPHKPAAPPPAVAKPSIPASLRSPIPSAPPRVQPKPPPPSPAVPQILAKKVENDDDLDDMLDAALGPAAHAPGKAPPKPIAAPVVERPRPQPVVARPQPAQSGEDYRRVYAQYVEARRKNGESTAGITYETLAKSLQQTKDKLRDRTAGKKIDFEVAVKDGKTILKPVVR